MVSFIEDVSNLLERHGKCKDVPVKKAAKYVESCLRALDKVSESEKVAVEINDKKSATVSLEEGPSSIETRR